jgi:hypothetical protein
MILLLAIAVAIVIALARGGRFASLVNVPVRWGVLPILAFAVQALFIYQAPEQQDSSIWSWQEWLFLSSHVLLLVTVWVNRSLPGMLWVGAGLLLNLVVMVANGGWMPVAPQAVIRAGYSGLASSLEPGTRLFSSKNIVLPAESTALQPLSDVFVLARPFPVPSVFSVGDVFVALGVLLLIQGAMLGQARGSCTSQSSRGDV